MHITGSHSTNTILPDWALPNVPVFPAEATNDKFAYVKMPESLRQEYKLPLPVDKLVKIPNPLYSYAFQPGTPEDIKVSQGTPAEGNGTS